MWDLPRPGLEPMSPALAGRFSTTAPPGKPRVVFFVDRCNIFEPEGVYLICFTIQVIISNAGINFHAQVFFLRFEIFNDNNFIIFPFREKHNDKPPILYCKQPK